MSEEENDTIAARNLALAYFVEALSNIGIDPKVICNYMTRRIVRDMDYFVDTYMDGEPLPDSFLGAVQAVAKKNAENRLHGPADFDVQENPFTIRVYNLQDCTFREFAREAIRKGGTGCPVCLITQISVGSIAAAHDLKIKSISRTYNTENETCEVVIKFEENPQ